NPAAQGPEARELVAAVATLTGVDDPDLRRRALALLAEERLAGLVQELDPALLVERLEHEASPPVRLELLRMVQRFGRPDMLAALLSIAPFDRLAADPIELDAL